MKKFLRKLLEFPYRADRIEKKIDSLLILQAQTAIRQISQAENISTLSEVEWKVFSQWGEDGIIQYLIHKLPIKNKSFVEFGVENYRESNTRFLLMNNNWRGLVMDGSKKNMDVIKREEVGWRYDLRFCPTFITKENINQLITENGFNGELGILSVDIDGNDYWVWEAIDCVTADIVILEYNAAFGNERPITIPYNPTFVAGTAHYSRLYFGASLPALNHLAAQKGYYFIGCTSAGNNAFFLNKKYQHIIPEVSLEEGFSVPSCRQARDEKGELTYASFKDSIKLIDGMPVINVVNNQLETL